MSIYIAVDVSRMLNPDRPACNTVHITRSDRLQVALGVLKLRMCITREEWTLSYDSLLTPPCAGY